MNSHMTVARPLRKPKRIAPLSCPGVTGEG
jgi:hypothetical protein